MMWLAVHKTRTSYTEFIMNISLVVSLDDSAQPRKLCVVTMETPFLFLVCVTCFCFVVVVVVAFFLLRN